jgi:hypothetical protein
VVEKLGMVFVRVWVAVKVGQGHRGNPTETQ